jgi:hypothetical protein
LHFAKVRIRRTTIEMPSREKAKGEAKARRRQQQQQALQKKRKTRGAA